MTASRVSIRSTTASKRSAKLKLTGKAPQRCAWLRAVGHSMTRASGFREEKMDADRKPAGRFEFAQRVGRAVARTPGIGVLWAPPRAAQFAIGTVLKERFGMADPDLPKTRPSLALTAQVALDEALLGVMRNPRRYPTDSELTAVAQDMETAVGVYERNGWDRDPAGFHPQ